jgi:hypothetical protein
MQLQLRNWGLPRGVIVTLRLKTFESSLNPNHPKKCLSCQWTPRVSMLLAIKLDDPKLMNLFNDIEYEII